MAKRRNATKRVTLLLSFVIITQPPFGLTSRAALCSSPVTDRRFGDGAVQLDLASAGQLAAGYYWEDILIQNVDRDCASLKTHSHRPLELRVAVHLEGRQSQWHRLLPTQVYLTLDDLDGFSSLPAGAVAG